MTPEQLKQLLEDLQVYSRLMTKETEFSKLTEYKLNMDKIKSQLYLYNDKAIGDADIVARLEEELRIYQENIDDVDAYGNVGVRKMLIRVLTKIRDGDKKDE